MTILGERLHDLPIRIYVACTGAGAGVQGHLWQTPGSSAFFVGAAYTYYQDETAEFIGHKPKSYVSIETAMDMAMHAYMRAAGDPSKKAVGLGLSAAVASTEMHRGDHRVHAAVVTDDRILCTTVILEKKIGDSARAGDGRMADTLGIQMILDALGVDLQLMEHAPFDDGTKLAHERLAARPLFLRDGQREELEILRPEKTLFYPGAFNPPHEGHFRSAESAWRIAWISGAEPHKLVYHITANPPHKDPLTVPEMLRRARLFKSIPSTSGNAVLFTNGDPLYLDKARRFPGGSFIIGADALVRMLDPKWGIEVVPLLEEFERLGTIFYVVGRTLGGKFTALANLFDLGLIPKDKAALFQQVPGRWDISSTAVRATHI